MATWWLGRVATVAEIQDVRISVTGTITANTMVPKTVTLPRNPKPPNQTVQLKTAAVRNVDRDFFFFA